MNNVYKGSLMELVHKNGFTTISEASRDTKLSRKTLYAWHKNVAERKGKLIPALSKVGKRK